MKKNSAFTLIILIAAVCFTYAFQGGNKVILEPGTSGPGDRGEQVIQIQQSLKNWGYYSDKIDGYFGWKTFEALKAFQGNHGLRPNGIAGASTLEIMGLTKPVIGGVAYARNGGGTSNEQLLARAIHGEARGEPYEGQVAVGAVILNRVEDERFPKSIAGVIYQPGAFTAVADGQINVPIDPKSPVVKAARDALNGWDPSGGCVYYFNPATATNKWIWSRPQVKKIGKHIFCK